MNVISPIQSKFIACEILAQANQLDAIARDLAEPWGRLSKKRVLELRSGRMHVILPIPGVAQQ